MLLAAASLLAAAAADPSADLALLHAFEAPCSQVADIGAARAAAPAAGWTPIDEGDDARIARLAKLGREATEGEGTVTGSVFKRTHSGRAVFLFLSRFEDGEGYWGNGCRLYDFDAAEPMDFATVKSWIGKEPTGVVESQGITRRLWEPWVSGRTFEFSYVPASSAQAHATGLSGVVLVASAIGGF
ncbi:hypothetical protein ACFQ1E_00265 [Sphingomonas canadensis]|uniref:Uncharacterized protein n=1 Tax=Sphingomonas canadensis TaxID=1219257 RepID=A0ABW3H1M1_9SPHN|nr:hypothetical protein [Sphingomonas canadensis]MCW3835328.1 hypothetical protein [Sphingomonas canadensis]